MGILNKVLYGDAPSLGPTSYFPFIYSFDGKGTPFIYLVFVLQLVYLASFLTAVNALSLKYE